ncbi:hypothetical protein J2785_007462 [Burkholderia ambifaria]|nr:hypothetical protein [Burkholderia ambifaria]
MPNSPVMPSVEEYQALLAERDVLRGELRLVTAQRDLAEEKLRAYKHELFGASSEARHADQLGLFNEAETLATATDAPREDVPGTSVAAHTRGKRGRKPLDPNLPREVVRHELPESERFCAHDGHALVEIGVETSEQLDVIPEQVRVVQHQRGKYACPCCDLGIKVTPAPARIIPAGCSRNPRWRGSALASTSTVCRCIARPRCCVASAATSRRTRWPPAWCEWDWPRSR